MKILTNVNLENDFGLEKEIGIVPIVFLREFILLQHIPLPQLQIIIMKVILRKEMSL